MSDGTANIQAMQALSAAQRVTANNVANVNSDGFEPSRVHLEDGPGGEGVAVAAVTPVRGASGVARQGQKSLRLASKESVVEPSGTDISREMVNLIKNERNFSANVAFFRNLNDMLGFITDLKA